MERVSREALASIRETVGGYRRPTLDNELAEVRASLDAAGIEVNVRRDPDPLPPDVESVLAWAVREGTTNILRHSATKRASIFVGRDGASAAAEVEDAGPLRTQSPSPSAEGGGAGSGSLASASGRLPKAARWRLGRRHRADTGSECECR